MSKVAHIPVFLASDDNYAPFLATTMYSILQNTKSFIDFYILDGGISKISKDKIVRSLENFTNKSLTYFDMSKCGLERFPNLKHYSLNTFSRYFIPDLVPAIDKAIYMDVDIIVKGDVAELYHIDLGDYPLGAVLEDFYEGNYKTLKQKVYPAYNGGDKYFNAGVLLLNIKNIRENKTMDKAVQLTIDLFDKLNCPDQDVFNILFENNFKILDYKYNFMPDHLKFIKQKHPDLVLPEPVIIHYTGPKPWKAMSNRKADFDEILEKTEFKDDVRTKYKIEERASKKSYLLFGILPLYKIKKKNNCAKHYLFGFIPFLKIKEK